MRRMMKRDVEWRVTMGMSICLRRSDRIDPRRMADQVAESAPGDELAHTPQASFETLGTYLHLLTFPQRLGSSRGTSNAGPADLRTAGQVDELRAAFRATKGVPQRERWWFRFGSCDPKMEHPQIVAQAWRRNSSSSARRLPNTHFKSLPLPIAAWVGCSSLVVSWAMSRALVSRLRRAGELNRQGTTRCESSSASIYTLYSPGDSPGLSFSVRGSSTLRHPTLFDRKPRRSQ